MTHREPNQPNRAIGMELRSASANDYGMLAWLLRSKPSFLRDKTVWNWAVSTFAPYEKPEDPVAVLEYIKSLAMQLSETFNEYDRRWSEFEYFEYKATLRGGPHDAP